MVVRGLYTWALDHDRGTSILDSCRGRRAKARSTAGRTWTHTRSAEAGLGAHAVEFSKTAAPSDAGGLPAQHARQAHTAPAGRTKDYSALAPPMSAGGATQPPETPFADPQNAPVETLGLDVEVVHTNLVERDRSLLDQPPRLRAREPEDLADQRRQVDRAAGAAANSGFLDLAGLAAATLHAVPFGDLVVGGRRAVVDRGQLVRERALGRQRIGAGGQRAPEQQQSTTAPARCRGSTSCARRSRPAGRSRRSGCPATSTSSPGRRCRPAAASSAPPARPARRRAGCRGRAAG